MIIQQDFALTYIGYSASSNLSVYVSELEALQAEWLAAAEADRAAIYNQIIAKQAQIDGEVADLVSEETAVLLPCSSGSLRVRSNDPTTLSAVVPFTDAVNAAFGYTSGLPADPAADPPPAVLILSYDGGAGFRPLAVVDLDTIRMDMGADGLTYTLSASRSIAYGAGAVDIGDMGTYYAIMPSGRQELRVPNVIPGVGPRTTITAGDFSFEVGQVTVSFDAVSVQVQYAEYDAATGDRVYTDSDGETFDAACFEVVDPLPVGLGRSWGVGCTSEVGGTYVRTFGFSLAAETAVLVEYSTGPDDGWIELFTGWTPLAGTSLGTSSFQISQTLAAGAYHVAAYRDGDPTAKFSLSFSFPP